MIRMQIDDVARDFPAVLDQVVRGELIEIERGGRVVARLLPAAGESQVKVSDLAQFFRSLPDLGEDAEAFARDIEEGRAMQNVPVRDPWAE